MISITIKHLSKNFGRKQVLYDLSYTFEKGIYGLLGPNGAGKTTLLRCILNLYHTKSDCILLEQEKNEFPDQSRIGYLPQKSGVFPSLTVEEQLQYFANVKHIPKVQWDEEITRVLELVHLSEERKVKGKKLSGGMVRRVGIAQALLNHPFLIIFDEPTTGLDPEERLRFKQIIKGLGKESIVLLSTHIVEDVEAVCDEVIILDQGRILASGSQGAISKIAAGKVYEVTEEQKEPEDYVVKVTEEESLTKYRILTTRKIPDVAGVKANVEDGYLCTLKGI